jgi:hypothetical protein
VPTTLLYQKELAEELDVDRIGALNIHGTDLFWPFSIIIKKKNQYVPD